MDICEQKSIYMRRYVSLTEPVLGVEARLPIQCDHARELGGDVAAFGDPKVACRRNGRGYGDSGNRQRATGV
jgi:hypothetical protein